MRDIKLQLDENDSKDNMQRDYVSTRPRVLACICGEHRSNLDF